MLITEVSVWTSSSIRLLQILITRELYIIFTALGYFSLALLLCSFIFTVYFIEYSLVSH